MKLGVYNYSTGELYGVFLSITDNSQRGSKCWYAEEDGTIGYQHLENVLVKEIPDYGSY